MVKGKLVAVDYNHPIMQEMKREYRNSRTLCETAFENTRLRGFTSEDHIKEFSDVISKITAAKERLAGLMIKIHTSDIPENEKPSYLFETKSHLDNLDRWIKESDEAKNRYALK